ncbi:MAG: YfhO family protein [Candidatus Gottesmanbacteria bacterium]|nr:YfhO family protein [Candidatus Gottesmanbacteria bacterium]
MIQKNPSWKIYEVSTSGYFTAGVRPAVVASDKYSFTNVIRLWIQSSDPKNGLYPELSFDTKNYPVNVGLPNFKMTDEVTFETPDGKMHNLFSEPPRYLSNLGNPSNLINITSQSEDTDMIFKATVNVKEDCTECMVILKQTYHPNWRVTVDRKSVTPIIVFPFFIGIPVDTGTHQIVAAYQPSSIKIFLLWVEFLVLISLGIWFFLRKLGIDKKAIHISH